MVVHYYHYFIARRTKNNPVLSGEPGVGKTAIGKLLVSYDAFLCWFPRWFDVLH